jgi:hypothetical protein
LEDCGPCPDLASYTLTFALQLRKKHGKTSVRVSQKVILTGHILCKNCLLKHVIEGMKEGRIEVKERHGRKCEELLDKVKERRGYWKLKRKH